MILLGVAHAYAASDVVEVRHDDMLCVSYQARLEGPYLVVRATLEPGWHTFAMDNKAARRGETRGQAVSRHRSSDGDYSYRGPRSGGTVVSISAQRFLQARAALVQLGLRTPGGLCDEDTPAGNRTNPNRDPRSDMHRDDMQEHRCRSILAGSERRFVSDQPEGSRAGSLTLSARGWYTPIPRPRILRNMQVR